ncbi:MAG: hypothetical protein AAF456_01020 [Planctomycetota bacterium]
MHRVVIAHMAQPWLVAWRQVYEQYLEPYFSAPVHTKPGAIRSWQMAICFETLCYHWEY